MNPNEIENVLRHAPRPAPPEGLKSDLENDIQVSRAETTPQTLPLARAPFWRRWLPALAYGVLLLGCFVVLGVQTTRVLQLRRENEALRQASAGLDELRQQNEELKKIAASAESLALLRKDNAEVGLLRGEVERLRQATADLPALRAERQRLQAAQAARQAALAASGPQEEDPFAEAKSKAQRINCVNNLKQICLAARMWSNDHKDVLPPDFLTVSNYLNTPKILFCPAQSGLPQPLPRSWSELNVAGIGYEMLSPGISETQPDVVFVRCPIHNNVGLVDGSVQQLGPNLRVEDVNGLKKLVRIPQAPPPQ